MTLARLVDRVARATSPSAARLDVDELRERVVTEPLDDLQRAQIGSALDRLGVSKDGLEGTWRPAVGQTYVLLAGALDAAVGRLTVERARRPHVLETPLARRATDQVETVLEALASALAERGRAIPRLSEVGHQVGVWTPDGSGVDGASLGVAVAVGLVSRWSNEPPAAHVASTARVSPSGALEKVEGLDDKLAALRARYSHVGVVVVADEQTLERPVPEGLELRRCSTLAQALGAFELSLDRVEGAPLPRDAARDALDAFRRAHSPDYRPDEWRTRARQARFLSTHPRLSASDHARALAWAALFHLHAGDSDEAASLVARLLEDDIAGLEPPHRGWVRVIQATSAIDGDRPADAVAPAERALEEAERLEGGERAELVGRALGTLGRARLHAGDAAGALEPLRRGVAHHRDHDPLEVPRSLIYLATALRRAGHHADALAAVEEALELAGRDAGEPQADTSLLYAHYERARIHYVEGRYDAAERDCVYVMDRQLGDADYPSLGCARYLAAIHLRRGATGLARDLLERARRVTTARDGALGRVAAAVLGEALLLDASLPEDLEPGLRERWETVMGPGAGRAALDDIVY